MKLIKDSAVLIISPSGNLYGSENVLLDYLNGTGWRHTVAVPVGTKLEQKLRGGRHHVVTFNRLTIFYALLFIKLVFGRLVYGFKKMIRSFFRLSHTNKIWSPSTPIKFAYAGAVRFEDLFFEEIFDWINAKSGSAELHIYSNQDTSMLSQYIIENSLKYNVFHEALPYKELPKALVVYDI